jgi:opacity protein-like surface antigen
MKRLIFIPMLLLALCGPAWSAHQGVYLGASYGMTLLSEAEARDALGTFNLDFEPGQVAALALGYDLKPHGLLGDGRLELEYARRSNALEEVDFLEGKVDGDGDLRAESLLLNTWGVYRGFRGWVPYLGAGIGAARLTADDLKVFGQPLADDDKVVFAYQLGVGVDFPLMQSLSLDLGYRFFGTARPEFTAADGSKFKTRYLSHSALLGLRFGF